MTLRPILIVITFSLGCIYYSSNATPTAPCNSTYTIADEDNSKAQLYIATYKHIAIDEMRQFGIPASITLAQGMLESQYGESKLATEAKNHFGIKCHKGWNGHTFYKETIEFSDGTYSKHHACFRKYENAKDSYRDHSKFLAARSHYEFLFKLAVTDYQGWAKGLSKAGYATDPSYAQKLITVIQQYNLSNYDNVSAVSILNEEHRFDNSRDYLGMTDPAYQEDVYQLSTRVDALEGVLKEAKAHLSELEADHKLMKETIARMHETQDITLEELRAEISALHLTVNAQQNKVNQVETKLNNVVVIQKRILKSDPLSEYFDEEGNERLHILIFPKKDKNAKGIFYQANKKATELTEGRSLLSIAAEYGVNITELMKYNEVDDIDAFESSLPTGAYIFLEPKATSAPEGHEPHQVQVGETMHILSQRYGVKLSKLYQRNLLKKGDEPEIGEFIFINGSSKEAPKLKSNQRIEQKMVNFGGGGTSFR
ncbi:MAG: glucosaminidase domain-containing protein [Saprospiraceae bacterium]|nr:glucosaminidase domain-containing protein [Saprospiraceae bacterium]